MSDKTETNSCDGTSTPVLLVDSDGDSGGSSVYKYRDFSSVAEDDEDVVGEAGHVVDQGPVPNPARPGSGETSIRVQKFPVKLYAILAQKEFHDIISWMPHGRSWKVLKPNVFESLVMPLFFEYSNYHSFNRLVNAWSFRRVSSGADRGSYYHELFLRGKPHLQKYMRRLPKTHKKLPMRKQDEPDFYMLDKTNRLPALEDAPVPGGLAAASALRQQQQQQQSQQQLPQQQQSAGDLLSSGRNQNSQQQQMRMPPSSFHHTAPRVSSVSGGGMYPNENVNSGGVVDDYGDVVVVGGGGYPNNNPDVIPITSNNNNNMSSRGDMHQSHAFRPPIQSNNMNNNSIMNPPPMRPFRGQGPSGGYGSIMDSPGLIGSFDQDGVNLNNNNQDDLYPYHPGHFNNNLQSPPLTPQMNMNQRQQLNNSNIMSPSHHQQNQQYQHHSQKQQLEAGPILIDQQTTHMNQMRRMQMQQMQHVYHERTQQQQQPFPGNNYNNHGPASGMNAGLDPIYGGGGYPSSQQSPHQLPITMMGQIGSSDGYSHGGGGSGGGMSQEEFAMMQQMRRPQPPIPKC